MNGWGRGMGRRGHRLARTSESWVLKLRRFCVIMNVGDCREHQADFLSLCYLLSDAMSFKARVAVGELDSVICVFTNAEILHVLESSTDFATQLSMAQPPSLFFERSAVLELLAGVVFFFPSPYNGLGGIDRY